MRGPRQFQALSLQVRSRSREEGRPGTPWQNGSFCHSGYMFCLELSHKYDDRVRHNTIPLCFLSASRTDLGAVHMSRANRADSILSRPLVA